MIRAQNAIRLGLRAATRNPELAFAKTLLDLGGTALSLLPVFFAAVCAYLVATRVDLAPGLFQAVAALEAMTWGTAGALACALLLPAGLAVYFLVDLLGELWLVRAAALGDGTTVAFGRAASLLGRRLGACLLVSIEFAFFDLMVALLSGAAIAVALAQADVGL